MAEAILKFNLPEEEDDMKMAVSGKDAYLVLWEIREFLVRRWKHKNPPSEEVYKETQEILDTLLDSLDNRGVLLELIS